MTTRGVRLPISVVIPLLNERESLPELHARLREHLPSSAELIFVDDGSTDGSDQILHELQREDEEVVVIRLRRNFGKAVALAAGFRQARGSLIAMSDADLQDSPQEIMKVAAKIDEGFDLVSGWRRRRQDSTIKVWGSWVFNWIVSVVAGIRVHDVNCGLKVMRREVVRSVQLSVGFHRFIPLLAHWRGFRVTEVEVDHAPRRFGRSRYGTDRALRGLLDLTVLLFLNRFERRPGRFFLVLGGGLGCFGFAICLQLACVWFATGSIQSRFPRLALGLVLMVVGVQVFSMGLFGELLAQQFRALGKAEPAAVVFRGGRRTPSRRRRRRPRGKARSEAMRDGDAGDAL